ncbi:MAG: aminopeptidase P family protein, partial [Clostridia bacterium]|nr:aminopeptidase P family protein [Clostridia bacterium]
MFNKIDAYLITSPENRYYFTGFKSSFGCLILTPTEKTFITDLRYSVEARKYIKDATVLPTTSATYYDDIIKALKKANAKSVGFEDAKITFAEHKKLKSELEGFTLKPASVDLDEKRLVKTDEEITRIADAQALTQRALTKTMSYLKVGVTEKDMSDEITYQMLKLGAESLAFDNIVAFGVNTANQHHHPTAKKLEKNELITFDVGAKLKG